MFVKTKNLYFWLAVVLKTTQARNARMNNKTKVNCLNKNSKKAHKSGFSYEP